MPNFTHNAGPASNSLGPARNKTFDILNNIGKSRLQAITLEPNFTWNDYLIPYSEHQLPKDENGSLDYATEFFKEQDRILSEVHLPEVILSLRRHSNQGHPPHIQTRNIEDVYQVVEHGLGKGRHGEVDTVRIQDVDSQEDDRSSDVFAMKRIRKPAPREGAGGLARSTVSEFEVELRNLSKCTHRHVIHLRASFTDDANFGFIVYPVAKCNLQELLSQFISGNRIHELEDVQKALECSFGCLLEAVRYLHDELQIKHRDVKPRNILMHDSHVLICDLGSSYDFEDRKESTDNRRPPGTWKYKAPEVLESIDSSEPRKHNTKVDIFSLGCIFLEIYTVLCEQTLDQMSKHITQKNTNNFEGERGDWTYASSLEHVGYWLEQISEPDGLGEGPCSLIRRMLCRENSERKTAQELLQDVRFNYFRYIGECCKGRRPSQEPSPPTPITNPPSSPHLRTSMQFSTRRSITSCKIARRTSTSRFPENPNYGEYIYFADHSQEGELEIQQICQKDHNDVWAFTRSIVVTPWQSPSSPEAQWLPAYYVDLTKNGREITIEWSDCDQLRDKWHNGQNVFSKVHFSTSSRNNLRMVVSFKDELDAADFSNLILESPYEDSLALKVILSDRWLLALSKFKWNHAGRGGEGSFVLSLLKETSSSTQPSRLEPLFVPDKIDFVLPLEGGRRYTRFESRHFWVPRYRSDQEEKYEIPGPAAFRIVELVPLPGNYPLCFEEESDASTSITRESQRNEAVSHLDTTHFCNTNLRRFFTALTDWSLVVVFPATDVQADKHRLTISKRARPADVMCFRKGLETRVAIRMKDPEDETTINWISATLIERVQVKTRVEELYLTLTSRKKGRKLTLASVTAADGKTDTGLDKTETWIVTVASGSGELFAIINENWPRQGQ